MIDKLCEMFPIFEQYPLLLTLLRICFVMLCISFLCNVIKYTILYPFGVDDVSRETNTVKKVWNYEKDV